MGSYDHHSALSRSPFLSTHSKTPLAPALQNKILTKTWNWLPGMNCSVVGDDFPGSIYTILEMTWNGYAKIFTLQLVGGRGGAVSYETRGASEFELRAPGTESGRSGQAGQLAAREPYEARVSVGYRDGARGLPYAAYEQQQVQPLYPYHQYETGGSNYRSADMRSIEQQVLRAKGNNVSSRHHDVTNREIYGRRPSSSRSASREAKRKNQKENNSSSSRERGRRQ